MQWFLTYLNSPNMMLFPPIRNINKHRTEYSRKKKKRKGKTPHVKENRKKEVVFWIK